MIASANLSSCHTYRYELLRQWDDRKLLVNYIMLNPSTADALTDDPTIGRCVGFAARANFGGIIVTNLFAFRATDPKELLKIANSRSRLVGDGNDEILRQAMLSPLIGIICCAWGVVKPPLRWRVAEVENLLGHQRVKNKVRALAVSASGQFPLHPLFLKPERTFEPWRP